MLLLSFFLSLSLSVSPSHLSHYPSVCVSLVPRLTHSLNLRYHFSPPLECDFGIWKAVADNLVVEQDGMLVRNTGSEDKWRAIRTTKLIGEHGGQHMVRIKIDSLTPTGNSWKVCVGVVGADFNEKADRAWVGSQLNSWSYICGTGGTCHNSGQSVAYGEKYGDGDIIGISLDFEKAQIEFFKNGVSQGVAFHNLLVPVHPAVSITGANTCVRLLDS